MQIGAEGNGTRDDMVSQNIGELGIGQASDGGADGSEGCVVWGENGGGSELVDGVDEAYFAEGTGEGG